MIRNLWEDYGVEANDNYDDMSTEMLKYCLGVVVLKIIIICFAIILMNLLIDAHTFCYS